MMRLWQAMCCFASIAAEDYVLLRPLIRGGGGELCLSSVDERMMRDTVYGRTYYQTALTAPVFVTSCKTLVRKQGDSFSAERKFLDGSFFSAPLHVGEIGQIRSREGKCVDITLMDSIRALSATDWSGSPGYGSPQAAHMQECAGSSSQTFAVRSACQPGKCLQQQSR